MQALFDAVNAICAKIQIVSNWFWDFPCNLDWYGSIPILGNFSPNAITPVANPAIAPISIRYGDKSHTFLPMTILATAFCTKL